MQNRNLGALIPAAKVLSQVEWRNATFNIALLDLARRRVAFHQENVHDLELRRRLTPDYRVACKRLIMSDTFYPAMQKPHVELVTEAIRPAGL